MTRAWITPKRKRKTKKIAPRTGSARAALLELLRDGAKPLAALWPAVSQPSSVTAAQLRLLERKGLVECVTPAPPRKSPLLWRLAVARRDEPGRGS